MSGVVDSDELLRGWAVVPTPKANGLSSYLLSLVVAGRPCRLAIDSLKGRHVLVPVDDSEILSESLGGNLDARIRELVFEGATGRYVDLHCVDPSLHDQFDEVVLDVLGEVVSSTEPGKGAIACIERWRRLFRSSFLRRLSLESRIGLFAELVVLSMLLTNDPSTSVGVWTGPLRKVHDFEMLGRCLEVKGLTSASEAIFVHGIDQLAQHNHKELSLVLVTVMESEEGVTLNQLVDEVRSQASDKVLFEKLLADAGWAAEEYSERYIVAETRHAQIGDDTPVLTSRSLASGTLPDGIKSVSYRIEVSTLLSISEAAPLQVIVSASTQ